MKMEVQPFRFDEEEEGWTEEEIEAGERMVITGIGPTVEEYNLFNDGTGPWRIPDIQLSPEMERLAATRSNAGPGNVYYEAHLDFLKRVLETLQNGGSVVCKGPFVQEAIQTASTFPGNLFQNLDSDWRAFGERVKDVTFGPLVPPILAIVLTRSASRDKIPAILRDLRDEWAVPRSKVWNLLDGLKTARSLSEAREIDRELTEASKYFSPFPSEKSSHPVQVLWELFLGAVGGAVTGGIIGGNPRIGAATGVVGQAIRTIQRDADFGRILFGKGAFDLAKRVRREVERVDLSRLQTFLSDSEKKELGL